jgi:2-methylcitrate dehydratase PrpD
MSIGTFTADFPAGRIAAQHRRFVARCLVDTLAAAVAGANERVTRLILEEARETSPRGGASCWITEDRFGEEGAALANAVIGHALDYDDVVGAVRGHVSVVLLPALLAMAEARDLDGEAVVDAYVVGFEIATRLGRLVFESHYGKGWHSTSVIGALSGAAACGRLIGLDAPAIDHAVGLALAQAGGTRANFGSMAKALQAGYAARAAVAAARLAARGVTAGADVLQGSFGFTSLYAAGERDDAAFAPMHDDAPLAVDAEGVIVKKYPMCYAAHRAVDAMLDLRAAYKLRAGDVAEIHVESSAAGHGPLVHHRPATGTEAMFSLEYAMAAALADGRMGCASFADDQVNRPALHDAMARVTMREAAGAILPPWSEVRLLLKDGTPLNRRVDVLRGSPELPLSDDELTGKLADALQFSGRHADAARLAAAIHRMAGMKIAALRRNPAWRALGQSGNAGLRAS